MDVFVDVKIFEVLGNPKKWRSKGPLRLVGSKPYFTQHLPIPQRGRYGVELTDFLTDVLFESR